MCVELSYIYAWEIIEDTIGYGISHIIKHYQLRIFPLKSKLMDTA